MDDNKLISIIIPAYNPQDTLLKTLESVFSQTYKNIEVIIVNDGSKKESEAIFAEAKKLYPEIKLHNFESNKGVAASRNYGISLAKGDYIALIDQDDMWVPEKLEIQRKYLDEHADVGYITSRQRYFLSEGVEKKPRWVKEEYMNTSLPGFLFGTFMGRVSVFDVVGRLDESFKFGGDDVDWFFRASIGAVKTFEIPQELLLKRIHEKNLSSQTMNANKELLAVVKMNLQRRKALGSKKISVIIPCFNAKKYIGEALNSVVAQGDNIGEIIVVDDCSTDGSAEYVEGLNLPKVRLFRLPKNGGISVARNHALAQVKFPLIAFLDADDIWPKGRNDELLDVMEKDKSPWVFGMVEHFLSEDYIGKSNYVMPPVQIARFASTMIITKDFFDKVGGFNEALRVGEFIDWYNRASQINPTPALFNKVVLKRRIHGANTSIMAESKNAIDYLKVARDAIARKKQSI